jgi:hypothetical protein
VPKPRKNPHDLMAPPTPNGLTVDSLFPPRGTFPGDTVKVQDPPTSNGGSQDSFGDEKGLKAPPGARGEYTERPPGNYGGPGGSIGVSPLKYKVDENNLRRRDQIPPMFLPAASRIIAQNEEEIDNEDEPRDDKEWKRLHEYEREFFQPQPGAVEVGQGSPVHDPRRVAPAGEDVSPAPREQAPAPLPLDRLNQPETAIEPVYSITGSVNPGTDTTEQLKFYNLEPLIENPQITEQMLADLGYNVETFSYNPERFKLPKLKTKGYGQDTVWIYDPEEEHGSFKDTEYTRAWRVFHEVGHGVTESFMEPKYGPSKREGRLGVESTSMRGVPPKQVEVKVPGLSLAQAQRAVEWEDTAFRAQQMLLSMYGVQIAPEDFAREYNVNIADALFRTLTGDFGDPGSYGYVPADQPADLRGILLFLQQQEEEIAREQGRAPTRGVDLNTWQPIPDSEIEQAMQKRIQERRTRRAFTVYPIPKQPRVQDERLLLQIPHDVQERYSDLDRRVNDYVKSLKLNALDMYDFPADPPEKWVEEERQNVPVGWDDDHTWSVYMGRLSHDDVADWIGLDALDHERVSSLAPDLARQHALEVGNGQPFAEWFRTRKPEIKDAGLIQHVKDSAKAFPQHGLGKGYAGYWRRRNHEMVRDTATAVARERHDRYLREVAYREHVRPNYADAFKAIEQSRTERQPLSDTVRHLHSLPHEGAERETVDEFRSEFDGLMNEGVHALDLYREPVSRDDRMYGDMESQGLKWVPIRKIAGVVSGVEFPEDHAIGMKVPKGGSSCAKCVYVSDDQTQCGEPHFQEWNGSKDLPEKADEYCCDFFKSQRSARSETIPLYRYGDRYFFVHESDRDAVSEDMLMIRAMVYNIVPGSSIKKRAGVEWDRKARALWQTINFIKTGGDKEAAFTKFGREYGPGLRKAVSDYLYVTQRQKQSDGGGGSSGSTIGDSTCSSFDQQSADNCGGCTFNVGTGGPEFGYGDGACLLTHLFLNAPDKGFGRGDQNAYQPAHTPGTPSIQNLNKTRRTDPRRP